MHLLLIHQVYMSFGEAGGTRHAELISCLNQKGHQVTVIASNVSYLTGRVISGTQRRWMHIERVGQHEVRRMWVFGGLHKSFLRRVVNFSSFMVTAFFGAMGVRQVDVVWGTSPPMFQAVTAWLVARLRRVPYIFEVRDLWPDFAIEMGILRHRLLIWMARCVELFLYRHADILLINSPGFSPHLEACGVPKEKIILIPNGAKTEMFAVAEEEGIKVRQEFALQEKVVVLYAGAHGAANDLDTLLSAAEQLQSWGEILFVFVGDGKDRPRLIQESRAMGLSNVVFLPAQPKSRMPSLLAAADICVATLKNIPMFRTTYPNKVFDYMAAARPTVLAIDGVIRQVMEDSGGGLYVTPGDASTMAQAILNLSRDPARRKEMGYRARAYVERHFSRERQGALFADLLDRFQPVVNPSGWYARWGKRVLDVMVVVPLLVAVLPLMGVLGWCVRLKIGRPVLFKQARPGLHGRAFTMLKFRTMNAEDPSGKQLPDEQRLTNFGRWLRRTSLDELPELFNVLCGDMSLVGPRPLLMSYLDRYTPEQRNRHTVLPGVTGWAQVNGRNQLQWKERLKLDLWYVEHQSLLLDLKILAMTIWKVLKGEGVSPRGREIMDEFTGSASGEEFR